METKKKFVKPEMKVFELKQRSKLLTGSGGGGGQTDPWEQ